MVQTDFGEISHHCCFNQPIPDRTTEGTASCHWQSRWIPVNFMAQKIVRQENLPPSLKHRCVWKMGHTMVCPKNEWRVSSFPEIRRFDRQPFL